MFGSENGPESKQGLSLVKHACFIATLGDSGNMHFLSRHELNFDYLLSHFD